jgi:hypothetical protein
MPSIGDLQSKKVEKNRDLPYQERRIKDNVKFFKENPEIFKPPYNFMISQALAYDPETDSCEDVDIQILWLENGKAIGVILLNRTAGYLGIDLDKIDIRELMEEKKKSCLENIERFDIKDLMDENPIAFTIE